MIERGRDELVEAMVMRWMRRVAGGGSATPGARRKDEIFPGHPPSPPLPFAPPGGGAIPPGGGPHSELEPPNETEPPGGPTLVYGNPLFKPSLTDLHLATADDAVIAAAVETAQRGNRVYEHDIDDLQPVLAFGATGDFAAVRGTATITAQQATALVPEVLPPNLVQLYARSNRYTGVRVAATINTGSVGLWIGATYSGTDISGYHGFVDPALNTLTIYRVDGSTPTILVTFISESSLSGQVQFQRLGTTLRLACTGEVITAVDATYGAGYVGFGALTAVSGDRCTGFEVTAPR